METILHNSSGMIEGGKLTAIMGSSGAGKTTMMNILAQRNLGGLQIEGTLRANGQPYDYKIGNISSYVQQDDIFVGSLTVKGRDELSHHPLNNNKLHRSLIDGESLIKNILHSSSGYVCLRQVFKLML